MKLVEALQQLIERGLTVCEAEVLWARVVGCTVAEICAARHITRNTYKTQIRCALARLRIRSVELVRRELLAETCEAALALVARAGSVADSPSGGTSL